MLILLTINKIILIEHIENKINYFIYLIIRNLSYKIWKSWIKLKKMIVSFIFIYKWDLFDDKIKIYYKTM